MAPFTRTALAVAALGFLGIPGCREGDDCEIGTQWCENGGLARCTPTEGMPTKSWGACKDGICSVRPVFKDGRATGTSRAACGTGTIQETSSCGGYPYACDGTDLLSCDGSSAYARSSCETCRVTASGDPQCRRGYRDRCDTSVDCLPEYVCGSLYAAHECLHPCDPKFCGHCAEQLTDSGAVTLICP